MQDTHMGIAARIFNQRRQFSAVRQRAFAAAGGACHDDVFVSIHLIYIQKMIFYRLLTLSGYDDIRSKRFLLPTRKKTMAQDTPAQSGARARGDLVKGFNEGPGHWKSFMARHLRTDATQDRPKPRRVEQPRTPAAGR